MNGVNVADLERKRRNFEDTDYPSFAGRYGRLELK